MREDDCGVNGGRWGVERAGWEKVLEVDGGCHARQEIDGVTEVRTMGTELGLGLGLGLGSGLWVLGSGRGPGPSPKSLEFVD